MSILTQIQSDALAARKTKSITAGVLVTLIGEINTRTKTLNPARDLTDEEVLAIVKKFIKNTDEMISALSTGAQGAEAMDKAKAEKTALETYLPQQMTAQEIEAFAQEKVAQGANLGAVMAALKSERAGLYDGKLASEVVRGLLAKA